MLELDSEFRLNTERLRILREKLNVSQRELARICGFGLGQIGRYEAGLTDPSATHLAIMADVLNVSADYLLGRTDIAQTQISDAALKPEEAAILNEFRRDGWRAILQLGAERIAK